MSGRTPVPGSALQRHPHCATTDHARIPLSGLPSGRTQAHGLPRSPIPEQPAAAQSSSPASVCAKCPARVAPKSVRTVFGRGALLSAPGFRPAFATTCARHGELGASTPKERCRCLRGGGINAATRSRNSLALSHSSIDLCCCCSGLCPCTAAHGSR